MRKNKTKLVQVLQPPLCPYWHYSSKHGRVTVYIPNGERMSAETANWLLDRAKDQLLEESRGK